jgi:3-oxoacyl-[acyl-carrier-protein] synthase-1
MDPLGVTAATLVSSIGRGLAATERALWSGKSGLIPCQFNGLALNTFVGQVFDLEAVTIPSKLLDYDCRNNRLAQVALQTDDFEGAVHRAISQYGPSRIATIVGTSSSGIEEAEHAYAERQAETEQLREVFKFEHSQSHYSVTDFVRRYFELSGPAFTVSTACSSSSKVFADAQQFIEADLCDAVVVGGVDSLCWITLCGFHSLQLLSSRPCRPVDARRDGISIGEAAGFALVERLKNTRSTALVRLFGCGESCDAHHMSAPHPEGLGAVLAMRSALAQARIEPDEVDYINLHGTGSPANDRAEDMAVCTVFGPGKLCSSTKGWTGHTLGAAGVTEVVISMLALMRGFVPGNLNLESPDPDIRSEIVKQSRSCLLRCVLTNSFGFGGSNCSLVLWTA